WSKLRWYGSAAPTQIEFRDAQSEVFLQVGDHRQKVARKLWPSIARLPDHRVKRLWFGRLKRHLLAVDAAGGHGLHPNHFIHVKQRLCSSNSHFVRIYPAPYLFGFQNVLQQWARRRGSQPPKRLNSLYPRETGGVVVLQHPD